MRKVGSVKSQDACATQYTVHFSQH